VARAKKGYTLKVITTQETCIASGQCSKSAPNVFKPSDDGGFVELLNAHPTDAADQAGAREAENLCPSGTIHIEDD
jgi:ferredoxin